jgi:hypothetical protein
MHEVRCDGRSTGAFATDRPGTRRARSSGASAGREVCRSSSALSAVGDLCT